MQPQADQRQQLVRVDGFGHVIGGAGLEALLTVALHRLGRERDDRQQAELVVAADAPHGLVAIHLRHHDVHQHQRQIVRALDEVDGFLPVGSSDHLHVVTLEQTVEREDVADVVIDHQHLAPAQGLIALVQRLDLPPAKQKMIETLHESDEPLSGRKVLVVDDDIRNIFALNSLLERHNMEVITATNGQEAINLVENTGDLSLVLMDVMMPEMDGYETMRRIRSNHKFRMLPIIALTAKAMKGDREKCLEAGASDYVAKPVNTDQLLSLVRMWLHP